jgi:DNA-binding NtrC family response regulator
LIHGETGTGKELVARIIHEESPRKRGPFHVLDSATIPAGLLESELFGARAGAFTGIEEDRPGLLALAEGGTILVDEIAGATLEVQAKLLRVLSSGRARPLGAEEDRPVDVRFLVSTSRDLEVEVREGRFREDLYYRIRGIVVELPPLRDRPEDLEDLARSLTSDGRSPPPALGRGVVESLRKREWPGNVRELANLLDRARLESPGVITLDAIETAGREPATTTIFPRNLLAGEGLEDLKDHLERDYVVHHFHRLRGNAKALAGFLHLSRRQLYRRCQKLGILLRALRRKKKG